MNYLAHLTFCPQDPEIISGVFLGDVVKGNKWKDFPAKVAQGILIHRAMDHYTDTYPHFAALKKVLSPYFGHWRGVAIDLYIDHILAKNFAQFRDAPLLEHTLAIFKTVGKGQELYPEKLNYMLGYMEKDNWLLNYKSQAGISMAFNGLHQRIKAENPLHLGPNVLISDFELIEQTCLDFLRNTDSLSWL